MKCKCRGGFRDIEIYIVAYNGESSGDESGEEEERAST